MILVIDIGNSNITFGIFRAPSNFCDLKIIEENVAGFKLEGAIVASVVTDLDYKFKFALDKMFGFETIVVSPRTPCDLDIKLDNPLEVGADRIANAVGVLEKFGKNAIVVDFGTATTFEVVTEKREFIGGLIIRQNVRLQLIQLMRFYQG